jgi:hypothetical protein
LSKSLGRVCIENEWAGDWLTGKVAHYGKGKHLGFKIEEVAGSLTAPKFMPARSGLQTTCCGG